MHKVVIDTNQFISGIISKNGASAKLIDAWRKYRYILIMSDDIINEIKRVLEYPHIKKKYNISPSKILSLIELIKRESTVVSNFSPDIIKDDPDDNKILGCAIMGNADYIVSGDKHLLKLTKYKNIKIITVNKFLELLDLTSSISAHKSPISN